MSYEIAIINPRKRKSRKRPSKAQLRARARFVAKFGKPKKSRRRRKVAKSTNSGVSVMAKRRKRRSSKRSTSGRFVKKTHATRRRRRSSGGARRPAQGYVIGSRPVRRRKLNPRGSRRRRYRRNPLGLPSLGGLTGQLMPAALGAAGGFALNIGLSFLPLPDTLKTGWARHGVRLAGALGLGWLAKKFLGSKGNAVALGALTIVLYDAGKQVLQTVTPELGARLGEFEDVSLSGDLDGDLDGDDGFYDPASVIEDGTGAYLTGPDQGGDADEQFGAYMEGAEEYVEV